ncbi:MAG: hypothetical protein M3138_00745 [Actinomycetota bacterium]|nr:hypothetical protein [Actinomycetota bacterium]
MKLEAGHRKTARSLITLCAAAVVSIALYVRAYGPSDVHNIGSDSSAYIVQIRAAAAGELVTEAPRPGVALAGAFFSAARITPIDLAPALFSLAMMACLGLAAGALISTALPLPGWAIASVTLLVATWGGTARLGAGLLGNLASLTLFVAAMVVILGREGSGFSVWAWLLFTASLVTHPGLLPGYGAILLAWMAFASMAGRRTDPVLVRLADPLGASLAFVAATGALSLFMLRHDLGAGDVATFVGGDGRFEGRLAEIAHWIDPWITLPLLGLGIVSWVRMSAHPPHDATRRTATHLGVAWLSVATTGPVALLAYPGWPAHRTVLLGVAAPIVMGVGVVGAAELIPRTRVAPFVTAGLASTLSVALAAVMVVPFAQRARADRTPVNPVAAEVASYLRASRVERPVVVVSDPTGTPGVLLSKSRQNAIRALAPDGVFMRVVIYLGDERLLLQRHPTFRSDGDPFARVFNDISQQRWPAVRAIMDERPVVLVPRTWVRTATWQRVSAEAVSEAPGLAILQGPLPEEELRAVGPVTLPKGDIVVRALAIIATLGIIGGGWTPIALGRRSRLATVVGVAPAVGLAVVILGTEGTLLGGGGPGGAIGLVVVSILAGVGWIVSLVRWHRAAP